ncbi:Bug family tripartite tricarboxylate transporter substrate binding protein [Bacillus sp. Marseille-P3661]|uniref:Bug family tripartite tricarboxylate transporter substrate binding protein n=1 Tax=Bacillus sp. Marseille-P3661 TaxID=1936234 RepID=UPI0015E1B660|nr:tripartite tricarboxylate transporter substrate binding protein [Bacillus sp. Marseille-P3661]
MQLTFKRFSVVLFSLLLLITAAGCGNSQEPASAGDNAAPKLDYPKKPINIIVPFEAGGVTDTVARTVADVLGKHLPKEVDIVSVNKPGAAAVVGTTEVINSKPDGYTIGFVPTGPLTIQPHYGQTSYEYNDSTPISRAIQSDFLLAVRADAPWQTFDEWLTDVKENSGKYSYGNPGAGSTPEIAMEALKMEENFDIKAVPFKGNAPTRTALLGGHVDAMIATDSDIIPYVESGELRVLLNFGEKKFEEAPNVPTAKEKGYDLNMSVMFLFIGPKDLPVEIRDTLDQGFKNALQDEELITAFEKLGVEPDYEGPYKIVELLNKEYELVGKVIEAAGMGK